MSMPGRVSACAPMAVVRPRSQGPDLTTLSLRSGHGLQEAHPEKSSASYRAESYRILVHVARESEVWSVDNSSMSQARALSVTIGGLQRPDLPGGLTE